MSQPIASAIFEFIQRSDSQDAATSGSVQMQPAPFLSLPGDLLFRGKVKPLSVHLLAHLSIRCRQRVLEHIETTLFRSNEIKSPAIVESYARLLYISPGSYGTIKCWSVVLMLF